MYQALRAQRRELERQHSNALERRAEIAGELQTIPMSEVALRQSLERRLADADARLVDVEKQMIANEQSLATTAAIPGAVVEEPPYQPGGPPEEIVIVGIVFTALVLFPLSVAYARRIWKRGAAIAPTLPAELWNRLTRLEESVDAVAVEVERIGEGQRFTNKLFAESRSLGAGAAQPIESRAPEHAPAAREQR
jgi:hypothetical protein